MAPFSGDNIKDGQIPTNPSLTQHVPGWDSRRVSSEDSNSSRTRRMSSSVPPLRAETPKEKDIEEARSASPRQTSRTREHKSKEDQQQSSSDPNLVRWDSPEDIQNPQNWTLLKKWRIIFVISSCSLCVTSNSSVVASTYDSISTEFGVGRTVAILGLSFFVAGLGVGPLFLGPFSEAYGRRPIYLISFGLFTLLQFPVAFANIVAVFLVFRFLVGMAGSAFLSVAGGTVVDMFNAYNLFPPMILYTMTPFAGPAVGFLVGTYLVVNTSWRWVWYVTIMWSFFQFILICLFTPETYGPKLLTLRARRLRKETGNDALYSGHEEANKKKKWTHMMKATISKVPMLVIKETMLLALCLWSALLLGILYAFFQAYPIVFTEQHGLSVTQTGLVFLGQTVGMIIALLSVPFWSRLYQRAADRNGGVAPPEERLPMCMVGAFLTVIGLFIFAFTTYPSVHWSGSVIGTMFFGAGVLFIYAGVFTYTTDCWTPVAASAMAANGVIRSSFATAFPLFTTPMYRAMGTVGATAMLAGLNVLMIPIPFVLYKYGARIRARSSYTTSIST